MENQAKINVTTDELAVLEFEIDALQSAHGLPVDEADLAAKQQRALDLQAAKRRRVAPSFCNCKTYADRKAAH